MKRSQHCSAAILRPKYLEDFRLLWHSPWNPTNVCTLTHLCLRTPVKQTRTLTHPADAWWTDFFFSLSETWLGLLRHFTSFQEWNVCPVTLHLTSRATQHHPNDPWGCFMFPRIFRRPIGLCTFLWKWPPASPIPQPQHHVIKWERHKLKRWHSRLDCYLWIFMSGGRFKGIRQG